MNKEGYWVYMWYLIISFAILIISILVIKIINKKKFNKKVDNLNDSAYFTLIAGVVATFIGFTLSMYAVELQNDKEDKDKAKSLIETSIYTNKAESRLIGVRIMFLQNYISGKMNQEMLYSLSLENNTLNLFIDNGVEYAIFSDEFKKNLPTVNEYINQFNHQYNNIKETDTNNMEENNIKTIRALKFIAVEKYVYNLLLENELAYLENKMSLEEHDKKIKEIMKNKEDEVLSKVLKDTDIKDIIPVEYYQS